MRGNHAQLFQRGLRLGSIPAGAGEPCQQSPSRPGVRVYPRGCGGTSAKASSMVPVMGLSPRVRGNQTRFGGDQCLEGSIPAGAGEPPVLRMDAKGGTVYPRGCGGTLGWKTTGRTGTGLSPRVRGNLRSAGSPLWSRDYGSIPAGAGEPWVKAYTLQISEYQAVYPARVRGNPKHCPGLPHGVSNGSIPAGAGEPNEPGNYLIPASKDTVYPRGCGGTSTVDPDVITNLPVGLSPRVRGNPGRSLLPSQLTGKVYPRGCGGTTVSSTAATYVHAAAVYPRGCGGTRIWPRIPIMMRTLRSIPAGAGEPTTVARQSM